MGVALPFPDRIEDGQAGRPRQVTDDMVQLKVHLIEGFLHMLPRGGGHRNEVVPGPQDGAQLADRLGRAERGAQEAKGVKILQPLAVGHIRLTTGNVFHVVGMDEEDFEAPRFQDWEQRIP